MKINKQQGLIRTVILIIVALLVISYMGISVRDVVESPAGQSNFGYVKEVSIAIWDRYLETPAKYLYNEIFIDLIWNPFIDALRDLKAGRPTSIEPPNLNLSPQE